MSIPSKFSSAVLDFIEGKIDTHHKHIIDLGCGKGNFYFESVERGLDMYYSGIDANEKAINEFKEKIIALERQSGLSLNVSVFPVDLESDEMLPPANADISVCTLVLHHIEDHSSLMDKVLSSSIVRKESYLVFSDLMPEEGLFHPESIPVAHKGVDPDIFAQLLEKKGLTVVDRTVFEGFMRKSPVDDVEREYNQWAIIAKRE
ncbi:hypothetical protein PCE1_003681 [Barthelona sp. PCE]